MTNVMEVCVLMPFLFMLLITGEHMQRVLCEDCPVRATGIIADLPIAMLDEFRSWIMTAVYKKRQVIFHEGTPARGFYILCEGVVKLYQSDRFGRDHILAVASSGDILGELPLDTVETYSTSAEALTDAQLSYLPGERLIEFIQAYPMTGVRLIGALSQALGAARRKVRDLALRGAEGRLADMLLHLAGVSGDPSEKRSGQLTLAYSRRELAQMVGISTETAIRLLGKLKEKQIIASQGRKLVITDPERLARVGSFDSFAGH